MPSSKEWNDIVNSKWPSDIPIPSDKEAIKGVKLLYRRAMGKPYRGKVVVTSGNRYTWGRHSVLSVNPKRTGAWQPKAGWPDIVHLLAHYCHSRKHPNARPHDARELDLEADLTRYAIEHGFLEGRLKSKPRAKKPKPDRRTAGLAQATAALKKWEQKQKRAETAIRKYRKKARYYAKLPIVFTLD